MRFLTRSTIFFGLIAALLTVQPAAAATSFAAKKTSTAAPVSKLEQLEVYSYTVGFKNTGTATWLGTGKDALTIKTIESVKKEHWFASSAWIDKTTVARLSDAQIKPGEVGSFTMTFQAPKTARAFTNKFAVYAGTTKIAGTDFNVPITVSKTVASKAKQQMPAVAVAPTAPAPSTSSTLAGQLTGTLKTMGELTAQRLASPTDTLTLQPGATQPVTIMYKNNGQRNWRNVAPSLITLALEPTSMNGATFNDGSWANNTTVMNLPTTLVEPGGSTVFSFTVKAPSIPGTYQSQFRLLMNNDTLASGSQIPITIIVPTPPPTPVLALTPPSLVASPLGIVCAAAFDTTTTADGQIQVSNEAGSCLPPRTEPTMRVGLASVQGQVGVTSAQPYVITDSAGTILLSGDANIITYLAFDPSTKIYTVVGPGPIITTNLPLRIRAVSEPSIITIATFANPVTWNTSLNDNVYRGVIEIQWSNNDEKLWMINELTMEQYLRGIAETSNGSPAEFQKAQVIAARSYALYHHQTGNKHAARHFDVIATTGDQYYRGYNAELRLPKISAAVDATRGQVVTYQGQVVITPYSASSNGMTRTWKEVWGGSDKPWLIQKAVPEDVGRTRFGHAVGMSQLAAADQAKAGRNYVEILKFFYVGTEVAQWYN